MLVDGKLARGCIMLAIQCDGARIETIEGADASGRLAKLQQAFHRAQRPAVRLLHAAMLLTAAERSAATETDARRSARLDLGHFCRCTGYQSIVRRGEEAAS